MIAVTEIDIYPVKSLAGISVEEAQVEERGLRFDRRWMVVDPGGVFITQREIPMMACIKTAIDDTALTLTAPDGDAVRFPLAPVAYKSRQVRVWSSICNAHLVSEEAEAWLSHVLNRECHLVYMPDEFRRPVDQKFEGIVGFADSFPLLIIGEASLDDLNRRLASPVPMNRFRPSLVMSGSEAFAEDTWQAVRIGKTIFRSTQLCSRCAMPTIDQETGERTGNEPMKTLTTYRLFNQKVYFGQFLIPAAPGVVRFGDTAEVLEYRDK